ncbi:hypothetical protein CO683_40725 [Bradyrhizobium ottawaense]|nr:hypothetical protein CO683_40725 [Bradyrhizobium ottawaense]
MVQFAGLRSFCTPSGAAIQRRVRSTDIVVGDSVGDLDAGVFQIKEQGLVEEFIHIIKNSR